ncbi:MAG: hypothetical protein ACJ79H_08825 [Myxococcales bacterium]
MKRLVPLLVATSLAAPSVFEAGHAARVHHVACPVDGQFEDAPDESPGTPHSHSAATMLPSREATEHAHRACEATPAAWQRLAMSPAALPIAATVVRETAPAPTEESRPAAIELYRLAPKLSPPT